MKKHRRHEERKFAERVSAVRRDERRQAQKHLAQFPFGTPPPKPLACRRPIAR